jgi:hypothetical protein
MESVGAASSCRQVRDEELDRRAPSLRGFLPPQKILLGACSRSSWSTKASQKVPDEVVSSREEKAAILALDTVVFRCVLGPLVSSHVFGVTKAFRAIGTFVAARLLRFVFVRVVSTRHHHQHALRRLSGLKGRHTASRSDPQISPGIQPTHKETDELLQNPMTAWRPL